MKLRPLDPHHRLARGMLTFARRADLLEALELSPAAERSHALVVVADGEPDNRAVLALAHTLNGRVTVDVAFPDYKHLSILNIVHSYAEMGYRTIVVVLDQEHMKLDRIHEEIRRRIQLQAENYTVDWEARGRLDNHNYW